MQYSNSKRRCPFSTVLIKWLSLSPPSNVHTHIISQCNDSQSKGCDCHTWSPEAAAAPMAEALWMTSTLTPMFLARSMRSVCVVALGKEGRWNSGVRVWTQEEDVDAAAVVVVVTAAVTVTVTVVVVVVAVVQRQKSSI